ncbi:hypothetical protein [Kitasatospora sp. NPDC017646]|uniref:hypothetical protein n=1 Tax=Kitasatospora sp. NPDC017646 TaxID=3364024 RepID=UPI0037B88BD7
MYGSATVAGHPVPPSAGLVCAVVAGFLGRRPVRNHHIGVRLTHYQENDEPAVRNIRPLRVHHDKAA